MKRTRCAQVEEDYCVSERRFVELDVDLLCFNLRCYQGSDKAMAHLPVVNFRSLPIPAIIENMIPSSAGVAGQISTARSGRTSVIAA